MASDVSICSNALLLIGEEPIVTLTDTSNGALVANSIFEETYRAVLSEHPWTFALKELDLSQLSQTPDDSTGWSYMYQMPADCIRVWAIFPLTNYAIVGDKVFTNASEMRMRYVRREDIGNIPSALVKTLEYKMAAEMAVPITEDLNKAAFYEEKYLMQLSRAKNIDSQGYPQIAIQDSPLISVRY